MVPQSHRDKFRRWSFNCDMIIKSYKSHIYWYPYSFHIKLIYSEKATKFCEISTLLLSYVVPVKCKVEILQNCVAFSEYMNFKCIKKSIVSLRSCPTRINTTLTRNILSKSTIESFSFLISDIVMKAYIMISN